MKRTYNCLFTKVLTDIKPCLKTSATAGGVRSEANPQLVGAGGK